MSANFRSSMYQALLLSMFTNSAGSAMSESGPVGKASIGRVSLAAASRDRIATTCGSSPAPAISGGPSLCALHVVEV